MLFFNLKMREIRVFYGSPAACPSSRRRSSCGAPRPRSSGPRSPWQACIFELNLNKVYYGVRETNVQYMLRKKY